MTVPNPVVEASEIVAGVAATDPAWQTPFGAQCVFCLADQVDHDQPGYTFTDHAPDCLWVRARRLTQQPVHPHKVTAR